MKEIYKQIAVILLIIGGLNWGLVGLFGFNIVTAAFGELLGRLIFIVIGITSGYMCYLFYLENIKGV